MTSSGCCSHLDNPAPHISLSHTEISHPHNLQVAGGSLGHKWTRLSVLHILICKAYHTFQLKIGHQRFVLSQMEIGVTRRRRRRRRRMESLVRQNSRVVQSLLPFFLSMLPISFRVVIRWLPTLVFPMFTHSPTSSSSSIVPLSTPPPKGCNFTKASFNKIQKLTGRMVCLYVPARSNKCILSCVISVYMWAWSSSLRRRAVDRCQRAKAEYVVSVFHT